jgi:hypothetical protein
MEALKGYDSIVSNQSSRDKRALRFRDYLVEEGPEFKWF